MTKLQNETGSVISVPQEDRQFSSTANPEPNLVAEPTLLEKSTTVHFPTEDHTTTHPALVPELLVTDTSKSISFWCQLCGFEIVYQRAEEGFAYISRGTAHVMLEQRGIGRNWIAASLNQPFGRGINLQINVTSLEPILLSLREASYPLFMPPETKWYRVGVAEEVGVRQFLVADPDGYLIRFQAHIERRAITYSEGAQESVWSWAICCQMDVTVDEILVQGGNSVAATRLESDEADSETAGKAVGQNDLANMTGDVQKTGDAPGTGASGIDASRIQTILQTTLQETLVQLISKQKRILQRF
ncbi:hypothetical protein FSARC_14081 [Fusarium sarcochroum]|uniref:Bleomycin resistance protein n=1 Tax=Fusarium sarcochroum TaxID=1208366 RepID=A0A8H4SWQ6_9HYPO|nr:hypothetical protein FSARC_14081 [Fusarium sarcochroum]